MTTTKTTYAYAVIPSQGCYSSGDKVFAAYRTNDRARAIARAAKLTSEYRREMSRFGYTSGGYRAVAWDSADKFIQFGHDADRLPTIN